MTGGLAVALMLSGCAPLPPLEGPDRAETVEVPGGSCEISWWLSDLVDDRPDEARQIAETALAQATVNEEQWTGWYETLRADPDLDADASDVRLRGAAYLESVRADVRTELDQAGYPDNPRLIEVYSTLECTES